MNRIELSGKSQGKGRNGYFQLHSVELMNIRIHHMNTIKSLAAGGVKYVGLVSGQ